MLLAVTHFPVQLEKLYKLVIQIYQSVRQKDKLWSSQEVLLLARFPQLNEDQND